MEIPTEGSLCWDFFLRGCTCLKCTNRVSAAPFTLLVQQRLLHPLEGTNRASTAPTELTIRGYVEVCGGCVKTRYGCIYLRYSASFATARARCEMPFLMSMPSCANDSS